MARQAESCAIREANVPIVSPVSSCGNAEARSPKRSESFFIAMSTETLRRCSALRTFQNPEPVTDSKLKAVNLIFGQNATVRDCPSEHV